jgi:hypothetical protein
MRNDKDMRVGQERMHFWYAPEEKRSQNKQNAYLNNFLENMRNDKSHFFIEEQSQFLITVKGTLSCAIMSRFLESSHLLGCGERAYEVHAALIEWLEEGIVLGDLDGEALRVEHLIAHEEGGVKDDICGVFLVSTRDQNF